MKKNLFASLLLVSLLAGCASGVKLDDVPVEDKAATSSGATAQAVGSEQNNAQTGVASVVVDKSSTGIGPVGVAHVVFFDYDSFVVRAEARPCSKAMPASCKPTSNAKPTWKATPTSVAAVNTTWRWVKSVPKPSVKH